MFTALNFFIIKYVIIFFALFALNTTVNAQTKTKKYNSSNETCKGGLRYDERRQYDDDEKGKMMEMANDVTMKNGTVCMKDGTCKMKNG